MLIEEGCKFYSGSHILKCGVNPAGDCQGCQHFEGKATLPSEGLIYEVIKDLHDPSWTIHKWCRGTPYSNDDFFGTFDSQEAAAAAAIERYGILAVDSNRNIISKWDKK
jgi:hypothetical protein